MLTSENRRVDFTDGNAYTKEEFLQHYGNLDEWNDAYAPHIEAVEREHDLMSPVKGSRMVSPKIRRSHHHREANIQKGFGNI